MMMNDGDGDDDFDDHVVGDSPFVDDDVNVVGDHEFDARVESCLLNCSSLYEAVVPD